MKNSLTFNILSKQGLPNGANEVRQNMFGAVVSLDDFTNIPNYKAGGDNGEDELITYKNNKSKVDGTANWNWSSDVDVSSAYNDQIKARLLTGNYGYNPKTGELVKLGKSEQTKVTDKEVAQTLNTLKGKDQKRNVSVAIPKEDSYNPNFIVKDSRGNDMDVSQFQGQSVNMTPAEATAYRKAQVGKNAPIAQAKMNNAFRAAASVTPVGMAINAMEGATRLGMDVPKLIKDPSLSTAGAVGMDLLMASPFIPAAASKTGQVISKVDDALMNAPRAQMTLNSGVNPSMMINAYQDARNAIDKVKGIKFPFSKTGQQLDQIKGSGAYWDEVGIPGKDLVSKTDMVEYVGTKSGRPVVNVKMPDGTTQSFYKSSGWAGKAGDGVGGTTEGMWQPFGGFTKHPKVKSGDWFIKDAGYKDFYGSQTYKDMAYSMDDALIKKLGAKSVDELDDMINFQSRNRPGDDFIPDYNHGGSHDPPQESAEGQKDWMMNYIQSPMYLKRLSKEFPDYSNEQLEAEKNARLSNVKNVNIKYPDKPLQDYFGNVSGEYFSKKQKPDSFDRNIGTGKLTKPNYPSNKKGNLYLEPEYRQDNWNPDEGFNTIPLHELGHAADDGGYRIPYKTEKLIYDSTNKAYEGLGAKYDVPVESYAESVVSDMPFYYKNNPTEFVNRLIPLRYELERAGIWKPGEKDFIDGMYNIMLKNPDVMKNKHVQDVLDQIPGADDSRSKRATVTKLLNEIALNDVEQDLNVAKHGGPHFLENNTGLEATQLEDKPIDKDAMTGMMKSKFATALAFGNPAAKRMVNAPGKDANLDDYIYTGDEYDANWGVDVGQEAGTKGSHYMAGFGNKAVPFIQERNGKLDFISDPHVINPETRELARDESGNIISNTDEFFYFDNPKDAKYFSEHYKEIAPDSSYRDDGGTVLNLTDEMIHEYKTGGYTVEYLD
jgi:hypothetical protein